MDQAAGNFSHAFSRQSSGRELHSRVRRTSRDFLGHPDFVAPAHGYKTLDPIRAGSGLHPHGGRQATDLCNVRRTAQRNATKKSAGTVGNLLEKAIRGLPNHPRRGLNNALYRCPNDSTRVARATVFFIFPASWRIDTLDKIWQK